MLQTLTLKTLTVYIKCKITYTLQTLTFKNLDRIGQM